MKLTDSNSKALTINTAKNERVTQVNHCSALHAALVAVELALRLPFPYDYFFTHLFCRYIGDFILIVP